MPLQKLAEPQCKRVSGCRKSFHVVHVMIENQDSIDLLVEPHLLVRWPEGLFFKRPNVNASRSLMRSDSAAFPRTPLSWFSESCSVSVPEALPLFHPARSTNSIGRLGPSQSSASGSPLF